MDFRRILAEKIVMKSTSQLVRRLTSASFSPHPEKHSHLLKPGIDNQPKNLILRKVYGTMKIKTLKPILIRT